MPRQQSKIVLQSSLCFRQLCTFFFFSLHVFLILCSVKITFCHGWMSVCNPNICPCCTCTRQVKPNLCFVHQSYLLFQLFLCCSAKDNKQRSSSSLCSESRSVVGVTVCGVHVWNVCMYASLTVGIETYVHVGPMLLTSPGFNVMVDL